MTDFISTAVNMLQANVYTCTCGEQRNLEKLEKFSFGVTVLIDWAMTEERARLVGVSQTRTNVDKVGSLLTDVTVR